MAIVTAHCNRAVSRNEHGRHVFLDSASEDVNTGGCEACVRPNAPVQRQAAQRTVRSNRLSYANA